MLFTYFILIPISGILSAHFLDQAKPELTCITVNNTEGRCVDYLNCNDGYIEHGGIYYGNDIRRKRAISGEEGSKNATCREYEWCCAEPNITIAVTTDPPVKEESDLATKLLKNKCYASEADVCPWCASLYQSETNDELSAQLFCGGLLIGTKVVLTTATCYAAFASQNVWARFPGFDPFKNYRLTYRSKHENYNSGTKEFNLALFTTEEEVTLEGISKGACLSLEKPFKEYCYAFGYDGNDNLVSTLVDVSQGSCSVRTGLTADGYCATLDDKACYISTGVPVICQADDNKLIVYGLALEPCRSYKATIGTFSGSTKWIKEQLQELGLVETDFVYMNT